MNRVVRLPHTGGERETLFWDQEDLHTLLGGPVTFVGAIDDLRLVAVGKKMVGNESTSSPPPPPPNPWCTDPSFFETPVRGDVVLAYSGEEGERGDIDINALDRWFRQHNFKI